MRGQNDPETKFEEGITDTQIKELIRETGTDLLIAKFTSDGVRFKNVSTYKKWRKGKTIYTLSNTKGNLLGLVWFSRKTTKELPGYKFSVALRVYEIARGKGYSAQFLKSSIKTFVNSKQYKESGSKGIWLAVKSQNKIAIKVYKKIGFTTIKQDSETILMKLATNF